MFENVRKNKFQSRCIVFAFVLIITLILYYICMAFDVSGPVAITFALAFSIIASWSSYYFSDKIILSVSKARPATEEEDKKIINILDGLMVASGLSHKPRLYVVEDSQPNAFATGRNPEHAIICVTTGLLEKLEYYELEGVIAHELAHIKNYDILLSAIVTVMVGFIVMLSDIFTRTFMYGKSSKDSDNKGNGILMVTRTNLFNSCSNIRKNNATCCIKKKRIFSRQHCGRIYQKSRRINFGFKKIRR